MSRTVEENGGGDSMLSQMMDAALDARKEEEEKKSQEQKERVKTSFGEGLFKKGFLQKKNKKKGEGIFSSGTDKSSTTSAAASSSESTLAQKTDKPSDDIPYIRKTDTDKDTNLKFPEVQEAMRQKLGDQSWMNEDLMKKISSDHRIVAGMQNPRCQEALQNMQKDPASAKEKYKNDPVVTEFLQAFTGLLGEHFKQVCILDSRVFDAVSLDLTTICVGSSDKTKTTRRAKRQVLPKGIHLQKISTMLCVKLMQTS